MGRGASGINSGSSAGGGNTAAINAPFSATDWRTWPVGTEVTISEDDIVVGDGRGSRGVTNTETGTVTAVYNDHVIVTMPDGTANWIDSDMMSLVKSARKK